MKQLGLFEAEEPTVEAPSRVRPVFPVDPRIKRLNPRRIVLCLLKQDPGLSESQEEEFQQIQRAVVNFLIS